MGFLVSHPAAIPESLSLFKLLEPESLTNLAGRAESMLEFLWKSGAIEDAIAASVKVLHNVAFWKSLSLSNERIASTLFRTCSRVMSLLHETLVLRFRAYPFKLQQILSKDPVEQSMAVVEPLTTPECMLDDFMHLLEEKKKATV